MTDILQRASLKPLSARMANQIPERMRKRLRKTLTQRQRLKLKDERFFTAQLRPLRLFDRAG